MEINIDNRIILALAEVAGSEERDLNKIFVFRKKGKDPVFFATNGQIALKVELAQADFNFDDDFVLELPVMLKKVLKYNKKEENTDFNITTIKEERGFITASFINGIPFELKFANPETKHFEELPDIFKQETVEQKAFAFNPLLANKLGKAIVRLGFPPMQTFLLGEKRMQGTKQNEEFIVEYILMGGLTDEEQ